MDLVLSLFELIGSVATKLLRIAIERTSLTDLAGRCMDDLERLLHLRIPGPGGWRARRRQSRGLCIPCGYDLRCTPRRCPECGTPVDLPNLSRQS